MSDLERDLAGLAPSAAVAGLVRDVAGRQPLITDRQSDYLSIRPAPVGAIAVYVHAKRVSVALEPREADARVVRLPGIRAQRPTPATTHLVFDEAYITERYQDVLDAVLWSLHWRAAGPKLTVGKGRQQRPARAEEFCPNCWTPFTPAGPCGGCY